MNNKIIYYSLITIIFLLGLGYLIKNPGGRSDTQTPGNIPEAGQAENLQAGKGLNYGNGPNRRNCLADDCLLVENLEFPAGELPQEVRDALDTAINDEYKAVSTYQKVIDKFGSVRPFSMIINAEEQHIASLKAIYTKYGLDIPENTWPQNVSAPETLQEACRVGVDAEIENAELYKNTLLPAVNDYEDITQVFTNLMNASQQKHLPAFEKCN